MAENFDEAAKQWDLEERRIKRASNVAEDILKHLPDTGEMRGAEYGCGTGLLGFNLLPRFKEITFCDTSNGMLEEVERKIEGGGHTNCKTILIDPKKALDTSHKYDCIFNLMVLHHIPDTEETIKGWAESLNEGGYLCIADLITEDGTFHKDDFDGHLGFDPEMLEKLLKKSNLVVESITTPYVINKEGREYPVFLMIGKKG